MVIVIVFDTVAVVGALVVEVDAAVGVFLGVVVFAAVVGVGGGVAGGGVVDGGDAVAVSDVIVAAAAAAEERLTLCFPLALVFADAVVKTLSSAVGGGGSEVFNKRGDGVVRNGGRLFKSLVSGDE